MTLAGVSATPGEALASLKRCKPVRAPIYREGDHRGYEIPRAEVQLARPAAAVE